MDKITYLAQLAEGLARWVPEQERQDILRYYAEYFEEAGPGREGEVVAELGDPWALSSRLAVEGGYVSWEQANAWTPPRKKRKVWPIVVGVLAALGVLMCIALAALSSLLNWLWYNPFRSGFGETTVEAVQEDNEVFIMEGGGRVLSGEEGTLDEFTSIQVDIGLGDVMVLSGTDFYVELTDAADVFRPQAEVKNGTLKVTGAGTMEAFPFGGAQDGMQVVITVPEEYCLDSVSVSTGLGNVYISGIAAEKTEVETGVGDVECTDVKVSELLKVESGAGDVSLWASEPALETKLEVGVGAIEAGLDCAERQCRYELETGIGSVTVNGRGYGSEVESRSGDCVYELKASCGTGSVSVDFYE